jgi:hypothetical protein
MDNKGVTLEEYGRHLKNIGDAFERFGSSFDEVCSAISPIGWKLILSLDTSGDLPSNSFDGKQYLTDVILESIKKDRQGGPNESR